MKQRRQAYCHDKKALDDARMLLNVIDFHTNEFAQILCGRLRGVSPHVLGYLKHELADFSTIKGWKQPQKKSVTGK